VRRTLRRHPVDPPVDQLDAVRAQGVGLDEAGFTFFTHCGSPKSTELQANPRAALTFGWLELHRQVRVTGTALPLSEEVSDAYFASRPRGSQIGAWASDQSRPMPERASLKRRMAEFGMKFSDDEHLPRPLKPVLFAEPGTDDAARRIDKNFY